VTVHRKRAFQRWSDRITRRAPVRHREPLGRIAGMKLPLVAAALLLAVLPAAAQVFPAKPLRIIIPNPPGVPNDTIARGISQTLGPRIGQPIVVENRPGADQAIGMEACARAAPDGYTLCFTAQGAIVVNAFVRRNLPYDLTKDFIPVIHMGYFDSGLVVHPSVPAKSFRELAETARTRPNTLSWGVFSFTSSGNFYAEWLRKLRDLHFLVVPYKAPTQMVQALVSGEVQSGVSSLGTVSKLVAGGKLRMLALTSDERHPAFPDVPTFREVGIDLPIRTWIGIVGPAGIPPEVVRWLNAEIGRVSVDPDFRERMFDAQGILFTPNTPEQFAALIRKNREAFAELFKVLPIKPE
jgi:tripartite-type tricarboxylate transporter receptor subunit TctC